MQVKPLPKPKKTPKSKRPRNPQKKQRIIDPEVYEAARRPFCKWCGLTKQSVKYSPHHIVKRAQGGDDIPENLISLCEGPGSNDCHLRADQGIISKKELYYFRDAAEPEGWEDW